MTARAAPTTVRELLDAVDPNVIVAAARTVVAGRIRRGWCVSSLQLVADYCQVHADPQAETLWVFYVDPTHHVLEVETITSHEPALVQFRPRHILRKALVAGYHGVFLAHSHVAPYPSGELEPSLGDRVFTARFRRACNDVGLRFFNHLVVMGDQHVCVEPPGTPGLWMSPDDTGYPPSDQEIREP